MSRSVSPDSSPLVSYEENATAPTGRVGERVLSNHPSFNGALVPLTWDGSRWARESANVSSVYGRIGQIVAMLGDYKASLITNDAQGVAGATVRAALEGLQSAVSAAVSSVAGKAERATKVIAGAGLGGGGDLSADRTLTANVRTVLGRVGDVAAVLGDYSASLVTNDAQGVAGATVRAALEGLQTAVSAATSGLAGKAASATKVIAGAGLGGGGDLSADRTLTANVRTVLGRVGDVAAQLGDYTASQINNDSVGVAGATVRAALEALQTGINATTGAINGKASSATKVIAGAGLGGGGDLSADRTLTANVRTVLGRVGDVVAQLNDYAATQIKNDSSINNTTYGTVGAALDYLVGLVGSKVDSSALSGYVPTSRKIVGAGGLTVSGGGTLNADVTITQAADAVASVFGRTGSILAAANDYLASQIKSDLANLNTTTYPTLKAAIDYILSTYATAASLASYVPTTRKLVGAGGITVSGGGVLSGDVTITQAAAPVTSWNARTGAVAPSSGDYSASLVVSDASHANLLPLSSYPNLRAVANRLAELTAAAQSTADAANAAANRQATRDVSGFIHFNYIRKLTTEVTEEPEGAVVCAFKPNWNTATFVDRNWGAVAYGGGGSAVYPSDQGGVYQFAQENACIQYLGTATTGVNGIYGTKARAFRTLRFNSGNVRFMCRISHYVSGTSGGSGGLMVGLSRDTGFTTAGFALFSDNRGQPVIYTDGGTRQYWGTDLTYADLVAGVDLQFQLLKESDAVVFSWRRCDSPTKDWRGIGYLTTNLPPAEDYRPLLPCVRVYGAQGNLLIGNMALVREFLQQ